MRRPPAVLVGILALALAAGFLTAHAHELPVFGNHQGVPLAGASGGLGGGGGKFAVSARPAPHLPRTQPPAEVTPLAGQPGTAGSFSAVHLPDGRGYVMHVPPAPGRTQARRPLVIVLHGLDNTWRMAEGSGNWARYADEHGFLVAFGQGEHASWNAGACCGTAQHTHLDDTGYLVASVTDVARRWPVDRSRVYVVGFSAGDMMAMRAECERPDVFAAASGVAGGLVMPCRPSSRYQLRIQHLHGRFDVDAVPFKGGTSPLLHVRFAPARHLPAQVPKGSMISVTALDCGHQWPRTDNFCGVDGTDLIWRWISRFSRPLAGQAKPGD